MIWSKPMHIITCCLCLGPVLLTPCTGVQIGAAHETARFSRFRKPFRNAGFELVFVPGNQPYPYTLEAGFSYASPPGSGCSKSKRPAWTLSAPLDTPGKQFSSEGWNAFCQMGWSACPDAIANRDYVYHGKSFGYSHIKHVAAPVDSVYCRAAGFLKPEIASLVHNFTAMHELGQELCRTRFAIPYQETANMGFIDINTSRMDANDVARLGAWDCAMSGGELGCTIAMCNYAYCEKSDGSVGVEDECEGWDAVHGMPAMRRS